MVTTKDVHFCDWKKQPHRFTAVDRTGNEHNIQLFVTGSFAARDGKWTSGSVELRPKTMLASFSS
jgi:hypothetical protein